MSGSDERPLSVGQQALWLLYRLAPESPAYNVVLAMRIRGPLDTERLARAVAGLADRHPVLTEGFHEVDGVPVRTPGRAGAPRLVVREVPVADLFEAACAESVVPFRLDLEPPMRAVLLRRAADDAALVLVTHHLVSDATAQWLIARDLLEAYAGAPARPATSAFDEVVAAERRLLDSPRREVLERYWRGVVTGVPAAKLPADHLADGLAGLPKGSSTTVWFDPDLAVSVEAAARRAGVTPFAFLTGAFQAMLHRHTGESDFLIGCPVTTRLRGGLREVVGYLANSVVLRATFDRTTTLRATIKAAQRSVVTANAHADLPFSTLTELVAPRPPLFTIAITMLVADRLEPPLPMVTPDAVEGREITYGGLRLALLDVPQMEGQFDLLVELRQSADGLSAVLKYDAGQFERSTIERVAAAFTRFVRLAVEDLDAVVADLSLVDASDLTLLLAMGGSTHPAMGTGVGDRA
ncbi:condensation domain-containing protein [Micromonospora sp. DR5-3]|uniref:condensation domain-containing protein n=1 Tax=unclassified Micromonospora TaxID=2617518 RepID=UPI0011D88B2A|nr:MULTISPECIES: condensation domain-containing protein [unclassified Micromonospora]MCW3820143.1 condensation domain-containing protein [Micromonospora sp. DR5-3]TYC19143.1 hypothetical protein FXF52_38200 [Micromonospora sp. MP36]